MLDAETLVLLVFIILAIGALNTGSWSTDNPLIWGPALILNVPFAIFGGLVSSAPILVPIALIALLAYFNFMGAMLGEAFMTLVVVAAVVVFMGV
ncbi:MAG: hypothetical protein V1717_01660 [Candidatus Micrarchaeota archaeon]